MTGHDKFEMHLVFNFKVVIAYDFLSTTFNRKKRVFKPF